MGDVVAAIDLLVIGRVVLGLVVLVHQVLDLLIEAVGLGPHHFAQLGQDMLLVVGELMLFVRKLLLLFLSHKIRRGGPPR